MTTSTQAQTKNITSQDNSVRPTRPLRQLISRLTLKQSFFTLFGLSLSLVSTGATLFEPWLIGFAIDHLLLQPSGQPLGTPSAFAEAMGRLLPVTLPWMALVLALTVFIRMVSTVGQAYLFEWVGQDLAFRLRQEIFDHILHLPIPTHDRNPAGRLLTRVSNDVSSLAEMFSAGFISILTNTLLVFGILVGLLALDLRLGLVAWSIFPVLFFASAHFSRRLRKAYREARSRLSTLNSFLAESLVGMRVIQLFSRESRQLERFSRVNAAYADAQLATVRVFAVFQPTITLASGITLALLIFVGGKFVIAGQLRVGTWVTFFSYALAAFQPIREISDKWNTFLSGMVSAERIFSIFDWTPEERPVVSESHSGAIRGEIEFQNVWFAYEGENWVLRDFSIKIPAESQVGVVGHTGAGKTTLISLLLRFYEPTQGRILLDGRDLREWDQTLLRRRIGLISQEVYLFSGALEENLGLGESLSEDTWAQIREAASAIDFDLDAALGRNSQERGGNWSLGERQILAYFRALAQKPMLWVLDEATANVDSDSESKLMKVMQKSFQGRTSFLIAHRLSTVRNADLILVLHQGRLIEWGTHQKLIQQKGAYRRLYDLQDLAHSHGTEAP
jgi:ATP-binding cassette subfamily B multidrug efflux pump